MGAALDPPPVSRVARAVSTVDAREFRPTDAREIERSEVGPQGGCGDVLGVAPRPARTMLQVGHCGDAEPSSLLDEHRAS
jgi:hypothetical protein